MVHTGSSVYSALGCAAGARFGLGAGVALGCGGLVLGLLLAGSAALAATPAAAAPSPGAAPCFYVANHGWHTGLVLPWADAVAAVPGIARHLAPAPYLEIGWGDEAYYRADKATLSTTLSAILVPTASVLHVVAVSHDPVRHFSASEVIPLRGNEAGYRRMLAFLRATFVLDADAAPRWLGPGLYGRSAFFEASGRFHLFNTCNTWTAAAVEIAGVPIANLRVLSARELMTELRASDRRASACARPR